MIFVDNLQMMISVKTRYLREAMYTFIGTSFSNTNIIDEEPTRITTREIIKLHNNCYFRMSMSIYSCFIDIVPYSRDIILFILTL